MSVRNIEKTFVLDSRELRIFWLIKQDKVILTKEALAAIEEVLA
jgi:ribosomal protein, L4/L1 family